MLPLLSFVSVANLVVFLFPELASKSFNVKKINWNKLPDRSAYIGYFFSVVISFLTLRKLISLNSNDLGNYVYIFIFLIQLITLLLLFLVVYDILHYEVHVLVSLLVVASLISLLIVIAVFDIKIYLYNDILVAPFGHLLASIAYSSLITLVWLLSQKKGMGEGDILVAFLIGTLAGPVITLTSFYISIFSGAIWGVLNMYIRKQGRKHMLPFVPFLIIGVFVTYILGLDIREIL